MEAEYIALYYVVQKIIWFRALLIGLELIDSGTPTTILIDNTSARSLAYNPVHHSRSKHIDVKFHWLREQQVAAGGATHHTRVCRVGQTTCRPSHTHFHM
jgi:hypothetical protein